MPYIDQERRRYLDPGIDNLFDRATTKGEINYCITRLVHLWVSGLVEQAKKSYAALSLGHSVLQDATAEYYRTVMAPYENEKAMENGPISSLDRGKPNVK